MAIDTSYRLRDRRVGSGFTGIALVVIASSFLPLRASIADPLPPPPERDVTIEFIRVLPAGTSSEPGAVRFGQLASPAQQAMRDQTDPSVDLYKLVRRLTIHLGDPQLVRIDPAGQVEFRRVGESVECAGLMGTTIISHFATPAEMSGERFLCSFDRDHDVYVVAWVAAGAPARKVARGGLGVWLDNVSPELAQSLQLREPGGALVAGVTDDGPAKAAGVKIGDVIVAFDGHAVTGPNELPLLVGRASVGHLASLSIIRDGVPREVKVAVALTQEEGPEGYKREWRCLRERSGESTTVDNPDGSAAYRVTCNEGGPIGNAVLVSDFNQGYDRLYKGGAYVGVSDIYVCGAASGPGNVCRTSEAGDGSANR